MIQYRWTLKTLFWVKEAIHKRSHIIWFIWNIFMWNIQDKQIHRDRKWFNVCQGYGEEQWRVTANGYMTFLGGDRNCKLNYDNGHKTVNK